MRREALETLAAAIAFGVLGHYLPWVADALLAGLFVTVCNALIHVLADREAVQNCRIDKLEAKSDEPS